MTTLSFTDIHATKLRGGGNPRWKLDAPLVFRCDLNGHHGGIRVEVPAGFVTDFASIPRPLWPIFPPAGEWAEASVVHDYLYATGRGSRFLADAIFREGMAALGVPTWIRVVMFYAVRCFGWRHWGRS